MEGSFKIVVGRSVLSLEGTNVKVKLKVKEVDICPQPTPGTVHRTLSHRASMRTGWGRTTRNRGGRPDSPFGGVILSLHLTRTSNRCRGCPVVGTQVEEVYRCVVREPVTGVQTTPTTPQSLDVSLPGSLGTTDPIRKSLKTKRRIVELEHLRNSRSRHLHGRLVTESIVVVEGWGSRVLDDGIEDPYTLHTHTVSRSVLLRSLVIGHSKGRVG